MHNKKYIICTHARCSLARSLARALPLALAPAPAQRPARARPRSLLLLVALARLTLLLLLITRTTTTAQPTPPTSTAESESGDYAVYCVCVSTQAVCGLLFVLVICIQLQQCKTIYEPPLTQLLALLAPPPCGGPPPGAWRQPDPCWLLARGSWQLAGSAAPGSQQVAAAQPLHSPAPGSWQPILQATRQVPSAIRPGIRPWATRHTGPHTAHTVHLTRATHT
jgi:hypothetical protein